MFVHFHQLGEGNRSVVELWGTLGAPLERCAHTLKFCVATVRRAHREAALCFAGRFSEALSPTASRHPTCAAAASSTAHRP